MIGLHRLLRDHGDAVEADLSRYHQIDLRDRDRFEYGRRCLTLRMIAVRLRFLPADSATATALRDGQPAWTLDQVLLADVWQAAGHSKKPHPLLRDARRDAVVRKRSNASPERQRKLADARRRARQRKRT